MLYTWIVHTTSATFPVVLIYSYSGRNATKYIDQQRLLTKYIEAFNMKCSIQLHTVTNFPSSRELQTISRPMNKGNFGSYYFYLLDTISVHIPAKV